MTIRHNERCKDCKITVAKLLVEIYGEIKINYNLNVPCRIEDYTNHVLYGDLERIYKKLQLQRNYISFVKANKLPNVDFFAPSAKVIVEFDESQHFTELRAISISEYPEDMELGFDKRKWQSLCSKLRRKDNDPPYRDEQRAWYDTLRDFVPNMLDLKPTIRLYSSDYIWCSLKPVNKTDIVAFKNILKRKH
ncbi:MAG: hypothetical protein A2X59_00650 [Nitrospirae bacterium GWC2_42_7]|nr:MAG: hypothetical protein A2X59_00650 [Nitrospirae bacterium GWC2_42_7]